MQQGTVTLEHALKVFLIDCQVRRFTQPTLKYYGGRLQLAGHVGVLLAGEQGLDMYPWHTIESVFAANPAPASAGATE